MSLTGADKDNELDPYSTIIVDDLLQGTSEWRNIQDIIRLSLKALTDVVKTQGQALRELEKQMPTRATKTELNTGLIQKVNSSELSKIVSEINKSHQGKVSQEDLLAQLKEYALKTDIQYQLSSKVTIDEMRGLLDQKANQNEIKSELSQIKAKQQEIEKEIMKKLNAVPSTVELEKVYNELQEKISKSQLTELLEGKANKQSLQNALHRKANKIDVDQQLNKKADLSDFQNLIQNFNGKCDTSTVDNLTHIVRNKADHSECEELKKSVSQKVSVDEFEKLAMLVCQQKAQLESGLSQSKHEYDVLVEKLAEQIRENFEKSKLQSQLIGEVDKKVDVQDLNAILQNFKNEISENSEESYSKIHEEVQNQIELKEQENAKIFAELQAELKSITSQLQKHANERVELNRTVKTLAKTSQQDSVKDLKLLTGELDQIRSELNQMNAQKLDKKEWIDLKQAMNNKVDLDEVQSALNTSQMDVSQRFVEFKQEMKKLVQQSHDTLAVSIDKKISQPDLETQLKPYVDISTLQNIISQKLKDNQEIDSIRQKVLKLQEQLSNMQPQNSNLEVIANSLNQMQGTIGQLQKEIILKANIKDVCILLDAKSNIEDINKIMGDMHRILETKASQEDLNTVVTDQAIINESLCTENIVGRWTWKSGQLSSKNMIPWESQVVNTLPDNFIYQKDSPYILSVAPGLYEISFGFFSQKKPTIVVLLNDEQVISLQGECDSETGQNVFAKSKLKEQSSHSMGNVTGVTLTDFLVLPGKARLSLVYDGEPGAEGFLGIKRL